MIDYIKKRVGQLSGIYKSNTKRFCLVFLNAAEGMGRKTTVQVFLNTIGCDKLLKITPHRSAYPLKSFMLSLNETNEGPEDEVWDGSDPLRGQRYIKDQFLKILNRSQQLLVFFEDFNQFDIETAFFVLDLAKTLINMDTGKTILFLISHDETIPYDLRNRIKNLGQYTNYILFPDWTQEDLTELFKEVYPDAEISQECLDQIINYSFKNAGIFLNNIEYLKERGYIYIQGQCLLCPNFPQEILFGNYKEIIQSRYDRLEPPLKDALEKASIVGVRFDAATIQNAFHLKLAAQLMKEIEQISRLIFQIDLGGQAGSGFGFVNIHAHQLIESYVPREKRDEWSTALAEYYKNLLKASTNCFSDTKYCEYSMLVAYCYENTKKADRAIPFYVRAVPILMAQGFYRKSLEIIEKTNKLLTFQGNSCKRMRMQLFYWEYQCNFALFNMKLGLKAFHNYRKCAALTGIEEIRADYNEAVLLYDANYTNSAYKKIRRCYDCLQKEDISDRDTLRLQVQVITLLCSIEETLLIDSCQAHFNEAAALAKAYHFSDLYYSLLRLSGIAYSGEICVRLLRSAARYFSTRNRIEYAMCLHNLATEQLFCQSPHNALKNFNKAYEIFFESGHNGIVCIRNGLAMYYALHTQQYEQALDLIYNFATDYDEDFLLLVIYYNITTILRKLGRTKEAEEYLKKTIRINRKKENQLPYFTRFIYAQEGYFALEKNDLEKAWCCFEAFFNHDYPDRTEYLLSAAITMAELSIKIGRPLPANIQQAAGTSNELAKYLAQTGLIFCEVLFWE
jgi:tetratricopeptide (TPR) repeat protein